MGKIVANLEQLKMSCFRFGCTNLSDGVGFNENWFTKTKSWDCECG